MLEQGAVLVPEEGVWRFYLVEDALVSTPLVHVLRLDADHAKAERDRLYRRSRGDRPEAGRRPPEVLRSMEQTLLQSVVDGNGFELRDLGERGEEGASGGLVVSLQWSSGDAPKLWLRGQLAADGDRGSASVDLPLPIPDALADLSYEEVWRALVSRAADVEEAQLLEWMDRTDSPVLPTSMQCWPAAARRSFMTDLQVPSVSVGEIGTFDSTCINGVPLVAESDSAAQEWAEWLLWDGIATYVVPSDIERKQRAVMGRFPLHRPQLPDAAALLERAQSTPHDRTARFLLAPADLGLWS
jgi:hypothetical protein